MLNPTTIWTGLQVASRRLLRGPRRPSWSFTFETLVACLRRDAARLVARDGSAGISWPRERAQMEAGAFRDPAIVKAMTYEPVDAGGVPALWCTPVEGDAQALIVYFHGGGFVSGSASTHQDVASRLCLASGARALVVDYRLAPEHRAPAAHEDALAAYLWALGHVSAERVVLAGDSAGGGLALATAIALRDAGHPLPAAVVALCPWLAPRAPDAAHAADDWCSPAYLGVCARAYLGEATPPEAVMAAHAASLAGLPPLLIQVGELECLRAEVSRFVGRAEEAGTTATLELEPGMVHGWHAYADLLPQAAESLARAGAFIRKMTSTAATATDRP
jgi:acetyl esterase/lipase